MQKSGQYESEKSIEIKNLWRLRVLESIYKCKNQSVLASKLTLETVFELGKT